MATDLLGKPVPEPKKWDPFYCCQCTATHSAKCARHGTRFCGNRGNCDSAICEQCDLEPGGIEPPTQDELDAIGRGVRSDIGWRNHG